jgi:putative transposase
VVEGYRVSLTAESRKGGMMKNKNEPPLSRRWAHFRFSVIGPLLAAPPRPGELKHALEALAERAWSHPDTGEPARFSFSTLERWYYTALRQRHDPVAALQKKVRCDMGRHRVLSSTLTAALGAQYREHPSWSYQLHYDNLSALADAHQALGSMPSYATVRRYMKGKGLMRQRRIKSRPTPGEQRALARLEDREVRSYEVEYANGLWHTDYHHGSLLVLTARGEWVRPKAVSFLDDHSRLACHVQWYLDENTETFVHGMCQAFEKRALPGSLLSDNGSPMVAAETEQGLERLGIVHETTLAYSPYQNGKQEAFWAQLEGRLMAMLEGCRDLSLAHLNQATQAWCELEYNRKVHCEIGATPLDRYLKASDVGRPCPGSEALRLAFGLQERRTQRRSDGTVSIEARRFEVPARFRHITHITVRFARWDLSRVYLVDARTDTVLDRIYPLDKARNADGRRRRLPSAPTDVTSPACPSREPPLLKKLLAEHAATGLPPGYIPLNEETKKEDE